MSNSSLTTARYLEQSAAAGAEGVSAATESALRQDSAGRGWQRAASYTTAAVGVALVIGLAAFAIPYFTATSKTASASAKKKTYPIDWLLRFGGAKKGQTFEKFIQDSTNRNDLDWEQMYRDSPASKIDSRQMNWKLQPTPGFK
jgi:hypothetical protein